MNIKIKQFSSGGSLKLESNVEIKEVLINEDFLRPEHESIALGFKNKDSSGLIELTPGEVDELVKAVDKKKHLIKGIKVFKERTG